ncbi:hypothetical protein B0H15DRAFT_805916 [Mycena belliarum]|uniref:Uncharacterized protein n=1 Tax=Mycena belliarum TaxID=1033014 RepID=A0AAD6XJM7_9AGAR|nr:hypothetical protein B0H15DRAFT_805916 [Mycena belliae]
MYPLLPYHQVVREQMLHPKCPELYTVWNAKPYFLDATVKTLAQAGKKSDFAFWNDAGTLCGPILRVWEVWNEGSSLSGEKAEDLRFFPLDLARIPDKLQVLDAELGTSCCQTQDNTLFLLFPSRFINVWLDDPAAPAHTSRSARTRGGLGNPAPRRNAHSAEQGRVAAVVLGAHVHAVS